MKTIYEYTSTLYLRRERGRYGGPARARLFVGLGRDRGRWALAVGRCRGGGDSRPKRYQFTQSSGFLALPVTVSRLALLMLLLVLRIMVLRLRLGTMVLGLSLGTMVLRLLLLCRRGVRCERRTLL